MTPNANGAEADGRASNTALNRMHGQAFARYFHSHMSAGQSNLRIRTNSAVHRQTKLAARWRLPRQWSLHARYRLSAAGGEQMPRSGGGSSRLDLSVSKKLSQGRAEMVLGVSNSLSNNAVVDSSAGKGGSGETSARTLFASVQVRF